MVKQRLDAFLEFHLVVGRQTVLRNDHETNALVQHVAQGDIVAQAFRMVAILAVTGRTGVIETVEHHHGRGFGVLVGHEDQDFHFRFAPVVLEVYPHVFPGRLPLQELRIGPNHGEFRLEGALRFGDAPVNQVAEQRQDLRPPDRAPFLGRRDMFTFGGRQ